MKWEPRGVRSSHWTIALADQWYWFAILALTGVHFFLAGFMPPAEDELYYWSWAQNIHWSYFDHPPMVAYLIRISTNIFGNSLTAIRLPSILISSLVLVLISILCPKKGILSLFLLTPLFLFGSLLATPDEPLILFWICYVLWLASLNQTMSHWSGDPVTRVYRKNPIPVTQWGLGGIILGLGLLSKYTMALAIPCSLVVLLTKYRLKAWIKGYFLHLVLAAVVACPILIYNYQHQFVPLQFQYDHATQGGDYELKRFFDFIGVQTLLLAALPFLFLPWIVARGRELWSDPTLQVCYAFFIFPLLFFMYQSTHLYMEANWPVVAYLTLPCVAQKCLDRTSFKSIGKTMVVISFLPAILCSAALMIHLFIPIKYYPAPKDRVGKLKGQYEMSRAVATDVKAGLDAKMTLFLPNYQWTAYFRYQGLKAEQIFPSARVSEYTVPPTRLCNFKSILLFSDVPASDLPTEAVKCFPKSQIIKEYPLMVRGSENSRFYLVKYWR
jgi:4-amino-4-deoxy-L-arabinose transferase-like glycosyltransferase